MDRSTVISLISKTYTPDAIGQFIPSETTRDVYAKIDGISQSEFYEAGRQGLRPEYRASMFAPDYNGEDSVDYNGNRYEVYRTYLAKNEIIELYLQRKGGAVLSND